MLEQDSDEAQVVRCLRDCGCQEDGMEQYLLSVRENRIRDQIRFLKRQRRRLMDELHAAQEKIDCVDYIIRQLEQREKTNETTAPKKTT